MAKNNRILIIVAILVVIIFLMRTPGKKEYAGDFSEADSLSQCNEWKQNDIDANFKCVTPCTKVSSSEKSCLDDCDLETFIDSFYTFYSYSTETC